MSAIPEIPAQPSQSSSGHAASKPQQLRPRRPMCARLCSEPSPTSRIRMASISSTNGHVMSHNSMKKYRLTYVEIKPYTYIFPHNICMNHTHMCLEVGLDGREQIRPHAAHSDCGRGLIQRRAMATAQFDQKKTCIEKKS